MKTFTLASALLLLSSLGLFAQGIVIVHGGGAVTVNGNLVIIPTTFTCGNPLLDDRDNKVYGTVQIGTQCWMKQNLNYGTRIDGVIDQTNNPTPEKYCYNDLESNCDVYGGFYQWAEMVKYLNGATNSTSWNPVPTGNIQGICPSGWHIPSDAEWCQLEILLDNTANCTTTGPHGTNVGGKMKEANYAHWSHPNNGATNESGFTALGSGYRRNTTDFGVFNDQTFFWSSTECGSNCAWYRGLEFNSAYDLRYSNYYTKNGGMSVRCLKD